MDLDRLKAYLLRSNLATLRIFGLLLDNLGVDTDDLWEFLPSLDHRQPIVYRQRLCTTAAGSSTVMMELLDPDYCRFDAYGTLQDNNCNSSTADNSDTRWMWPRRTITWRWPCAIGRFRLAESLVFKGGTALHHCYLPQHRFSEDLDFTSLVRGI